MKPLKQKICRVCGVTFDPKGPAARYCAGCAAKMAEEADRRKILKYQKKKLGDRFGIGSGNGQPKGKDDSQYKNGITQFLKSIHRLKEETRCCPSCGKDLKDAAPGEWVTHHIDGNRDNNDPSNWITLCKRCHQLQHRCWENLPQYQKPVHNVIQFPTSTEPAKTLIQAEGNNVEPAKTA